MADVTQTVVPVTYAHMRERCAHLRTVVERLPGYWHGEVPGILPLPGAAVPAAYLAGMLDAELLEEHRAGCVVLGLLTVPPSLHAAQDLIDRWGRGVASVLFLWRREGAPYILTTHPGPAPGPEGVPVDLGPAAFPLEAAALPGAPEDPDAAVWVPWD